MSLATGEDKLEFKSSLQTTAAWRKSITGINVDQRICKYPKLATAVRALPVGKRSKPAAQKNP